MPVTGRCKPVAMGPECSTKAEKARARRAAGVGGTRRIHDDSRAAPHRHPKQRKSTDQCPRQERPEMCREGSDGPYRRERRNGEQRARRHEVDGLGTRPSTGADRQTEAEPSRPPRTPATDLGGEQDRREPEGERRVAKAALLSAVDDDGHRPHPGGQADEQRDRLCEHVPGDPPDEDRRGQRQQGRREVQSDIVLAEHTEQGCRHVGLYAAVVLAPVERREVTVKDVARHQAHDRLVGVDAPVPKKPEPHQKTQSTEPGGQNPESRPSVEPCSCRFFSTASWGCLSNRLVTTGRSQQHAANPNGRSPCSSGFRSLVAGRTGAIPSAA